MFKASKQILDDFAQLQSMIDAEMRYGLKYVEEQEILFGDGTGAHLHGIVPQATALRRHLPLNSRTVLTICVWQCFRLNLPASRHPVTFCTSLTGRKSN
jgi:HK97 family phage major capsid protein